MIFVDSKIPIGNNITMSIDRMYEEYAINATISCGRHYFHYFA